MFTVVVSTSKADNDNKNLRWGGEGRGQGSALSRMVRCILDKPRTGVRVDVI